ncbi:MAG: response regulator transcription factor [Chloroflexi bacterium OHK40]
MIRVLVVDDHPVVRHGLASMLRLTPDVELVGEAADGQEALDAILARAPDVVLLDLRMPRLSGVEVMRAARERGSTARFLVLTTYDTDEYIGPALAAGAQGYLLKDSPPEELLRAVRTLAQGQVALEPAVVARLLARVTEGPASDELSARELEVIRLLVGGASNKEIATALGLSENTIKTHLSRIFDKLGARSRAEVVAIALQRGLLSSS